MSREFHPKIGILGGAFDPPHLSHIDMARQLVSERGYERMILLPSHNPPHKQLATAGEHRYNMLQLISEGLYEVSRVELDFDGVGYTCDYLPRLKELYGEDIEYIIGGDSILAFDSWSRPLEILKQTHILVVARDGDKDRCRDAIARYDGVEKQGITLAEFTPAGISSTAIRDRLRLHLPVDGMIDSRVYDYIRQYGLYDEYADIHSRLRDTLRDERYVHSQMTALFALDNYHRYHSLDYSKVLQSALLHDCAKYCVDIDSLRDYAECHCPEYWREDAIGTPVAHAFLGALVAMRDYGITDREILDAIYYHTTARVDMTDLDELVYTADVLEPMRRYDGVERLREIFAECPHRGFIECLETGYRHLIDIGMSVYPLTCEAYRYYILDSEERC